MLVGVELAFGFVEWSKRARCLLAADPDIWFPHPGDGAYEAKAECGRCPVRAQCLAEAIISGEQVGIWGGLAVRDRKVLAERWQGGESLKDLVENAVTRRMFSTFFQGRQ